MAKTTYYFEPLNPKKMVLSRQTGKTDGLCLTLLDEDNKRIRAYEGVTVKRAFPISQADELITFADKEGNEIGVLLHTDQLDDRSRNALEEEMRLAYFVPRIERIISFKDEYGLRLWEVQTDRGPRTFATQTRYDVRQVGPRRYFIRDVDGNRYEIADIGGLDSRSQANLSAEL